MRDLSLRRGGRTLFSGLNFGVGSGCAVMLRGENGAGKTSLLRALAGLSQPERGTIVFSADGEPVDAEDAIQLQTHLIGHYEGFAGLRSARQELAFALQWANGKPDVASSAAEQLRMTPFLDLPVRRLSAGQRRRLALIKLVAAPRTLWLLDEPETALDQPGRAWFAETLESHLAAGGMVVAASHNLMHVNADVVEIAA